MNNKLKKFTLLLGDIVVLYAALYLTLLIRYLRQPQAQTWHEHLLPFSIIFIVWLLIFYIADLYNLHLAVNNSKFFQLTIRSIIIAGLASAAFFYINPNITIAPKTNLLIYLIVFALLFILWRRLYNWLLRSYIPKENILIIGFNGQVRGLINALREKPHLGYNIAAIINNQPIEAAGIPIITDYAQLKDIIINKKITTIVLAADPHQSAELRQALFKCLSLNIKLVSLPYFYEILTGKIPVEAISEMWFLENLSEGRKTNFDWLKRLYDLVLALILLIITLPLWLIIIFIIKLRSKGPAFYLNARLGKNNKVFNLIKFRTMREDHNDRSLTVKNDPRITGFGRFLRRTRIDEIPQVINILRGEMSFVGPRPERPELIKELEQVVPFYHERMLVKPGLTGWDQVSGEYHSPTREDTLKKLQYDLYYIKNRSIYLDLSIILKTIATVLSKRGV